MTVKRDPKEPKTWICRVDWYDIAGKRHQKYKQGFTTQREAKEWGETVYRANNGKIEKLDELLMRTFLDQWLEARKDFLEPGTVRVYSDHIKRLNRHIGDIRLVRLDLLTVQKAVNAMAQEKFNGHKVSPHIPKKALHTLHNALEFAVKAGYVDRNIAHYAEAPRTERYIANILDAPTVLRALELLKQQDEEIYIPAMLAALLGLRRGEALGLSWENVDFVNKVVHIKTQYADAGAGRKGVHKKLKTQSSTRNIPMSSVVAHELQSLRNVKLSSGRIDTYVCEVNGSIIKPSTLSERWGRFVARNKLPHVRFHDLRHTFATLQLEVGTDIKTISGLLGHCDIATTADIYVHNTPKLATAAVDNLEHLVFSTKKEENAKAE